MKPRGAARPQARPEDIFSGYGTSDSYSLAFDEMFDAQGNVRVPYKGIYACLLYTSRCV